MCPRKWLPRHSLNSWAIPACICSWRIPAILICNLKTWVSKWDRMTILRSFFQTHRQANEQQSVFFPIGSMYGIFTYIWFNFMVNVGKYTIHGSYGFGTKIHQQQPSNPATNTQQPTTWGLCLCQQSTWVRARTSFQSQRDIFFSCLKSVVMGWTIFWGVGLGFGEQNKSDKGTRGRTQDGCQFQGVCISLR